MQKMEQFFKTKPFFWIFIPIFFLLKNINIYDGLIPAGQLAWLFVRYVLLAIILYFVIYRLTGKIVFKTAFYCLLLLSVYFFYTSFDYFIQKQDWLKPISRYRYFLPFFATGLAVALYFIHRMPRPPVQTILFLNLLLPIFCLMETIQICANWTKPHKSLLGLENGVSFSPGAPRHHPYPNIYFLLFDEYQGNAGLKKNFDYDNTRLIQTFRNDSFYIPKFSRSNYSFTLYSMPSIFNMSYLKGDIEGKSDFESFLKANSGYNLVKNASVFNFLKRNKYTIKNLSAFIIDESGESISKYRSIKAGKDIIESQTLFYNLANQFAWHIDSKVWWDLTNPVDYYNRYYNKYIEDRLVNELADSHNRGPIFTYAHFFMPHEPYLKDSSGNDVSLKYLMEEHPVATRKALYLGYLKYCNTNLIDMVGSIIKEDPQSIIIVMSDHGLRDGDSTNMQFNNQFSIRIPGADYTNWPDTVDAVNMFRILLNTQFGQKLDYLPYRSAKFKSDRNPRHDNP